MDAKISPLHSNDRLKSKAIVTGHLVISQVFFYKKLILILCSIFVLGMISPVVIGEEIPNNASSITGVTSSEFNLFLSESQPQTATAPFTQRPQDDERPDDQFTFQWLKRPLVIGGEFEAELRYREDLSLGRRDDDDLRFSLNLQLEFLYQLTANTSIYAEFDSHYQEELYSEDHDTESTRKIKLGELWLAVGGFGNQRFGLQIGRQYFGDQREWWWDKQLDAVRIQYKADSFSTQFGLGANPTTISTENDLLDPEDEDITWLLASADWEWSRKNHFEAFFLSRFDRSATPEVGDIIAKELEDDEDGAISWLGLRSRGRLKASGAGKIYYWLDSGVVYGRESLIDFDSIGEGNQSIVDQRLERTINGWGMDLGATWESKLPYKPRLTLGYGRGSGDGNTNDSMDRAYRQSGLQSNDDKFRGVNSFRYYGELLRPELSNLTIKTIALGFPLWKDSSLEIVYHRYMQVHAADQLRNSRLRTNPEGVHRDIGEEFNLILGIEEWQQLEIEVIAAQFLSGKAFGVFADRTSSNITMQLEYNF